MIAEDFSSPSSATPWGRGRVDRCTVSDYPGRRTLRPRRRARRRLDPHRTIRRAKHQPSPVEDPLRDRVRHRHPVQRVACCVALPEPLTRSGACRGGTLGGMSEDTRSVPHRTLGRTGSVVAALALGCSSMSGLIGAGADDEVAAATIRAAVDQGVDLIDTADFYGLGHNESLIARALAGVPRDRYLLSDKFGGLRDPSGAFIGTDCRPGNPEDLPRLLPAAPPHRLRRHLPPGPARPRRSRRGDGRSDRRTHPGRVRPRHRPVRG